MRVPRDLSGQELLKLPHRRSDGKHFGYEKTRQVGSHIRATTQQNGEHHISIPNHNPIKLGTLSGIIGDVANHSQISKDEVLSLLFG